MHGYLFQAFLKSRNTVSIPTRSPRKLRYMFTSFKEREIERLHFFHQIRPIGRGFSNRNMCISSVYPKGDHNMYYPHHFSLAFSYVYKMIYSLWLWHISDVSHTYLKHHGHIETIIFCYISCFSWVQFKHFWHILDLRYI